MQHDIRSLDRPPRIGRRPQITVRQTVRPNVRRWREAELVDAREHAAADEAVGSRDEKAFVSPPPRFGRLHSNSRDFLSKDKFFPPRREAIAHFSDLQLSAHGISVE